MKLAEIQCLNPFLQVYLLLPYEYQAQPLFTEASLNPFLQVYLLLLRGANLRFAHLEGVLIPFYRSISYYTHDNRP